MKKKMIISIILIICISVIIYFIYSYIRIKTAKIEVTLKEDLTLEFNDRKKVSDFIESINGEIINDYTIDSLKLGDKNINFEFINNDKIKVSYNFKIKVVDTTKPLIWLGDIYQIKKGSDIDLENEILCGDNYDNNPNCYIEGDYDLNKVGNYSLVYNAIDSSGNTSIKPFTLQIFEPNNDNLNNEDESNYIYFKDIKQKYKTENNKIGIDVSSWQGDINFEKIKNAGVEFIMIRVGSTKGTNKEYFLDEKFIKNITGANKYNIDVGVYFYSYSNSNESAIKDAKWVLNQIDGYDVNLPIAYDFEDWNNFNNYNLSFFGLTNMAESFLDTVKKEGYDGMLYGSKAYLENIWLPTKYDKWVAHYTDNTDYKGKYRMWQLTNNGKIDGISGPVDIDILYY